jgi:large subunit ribosomal protein L23
MKISKVLIQPVVSEKSFSLAEKGVYMFRVARDANKKEIAKAVERVFEVSVENVRTLNRKGKPVMDWSSMNESNRKNYKVAYIELSEGDSIEIFN